jgi:murein DD-endopeptidase MepM/ murein hydrolase activator NlpD
MIKEQRPLLQNKVLFAVFSVFLLHYAYIMIQGLNDLVQQENSHSLREQLGLANERIAQMEHRMAALNNLDEKLRELASLENAKKGLVLDSLEEANAQHNPNSKLSAFELPIGIDMSSLQESIFASRLEGLAEETQRQLKSLSSLVDYFSIQKTLLSKTPSIWPSKGWVSSPFGLRIDPYTGNQAFHTGIDIAASAGSKVVAPAAGQVLFVGKNGAYGNLLRIDHGQGIVTQYGHLQSSNVQIGDYVKRGDTIAFLGNSGRSTGPHLHYEVWQNGFAVNPRKFIIE